MTQIDESGEGWSVLARARRADGIEIVDGAELMAGGQVEDPVADGANLGGRIFERL